MLNPWVGGSISRFDWVGEDGAHELLRGCNGQPENVLDAASFPLVPYVNRIRGGAFAFRERTVQLTPNLAGDRSPLHGQGWLRPWTVEHLDKRSATLRFLHHGGEWPWDYEAQQDFALDPGGLTVVLSCRNRSSDPMPCGLGQHPYFLCTAATRIDTGVTHAWTIDADILPVDSVAAAGRFDLRDRAVCGQDLDHGFGGWNGIATLTDPDWPANVILSSPDAKFFQLYSPEEGGLFVAEPVTHANAALNAPESDWAKLGLRILEPGEAMSLTMRLDVQQKSGGSG